MSGFFEVIKESSSQMVTGILSLLFDSFRIFIVSLESLLSQLSRKSEYALME